MTEANLRLVVSIARRYASSGVPLMDLIQQGNLALMRAVARFDPQRGLKMSTYATWWLQQHPRWEANRCACLPASDNATSSPVAVSPPRSLAARRMLSLASKPAHPRP